MDIENISLDRLSLESISLVTPEVYEINTTGVVSAIQTPDIPFSQSSTEDESVSKFKSSEIPKPLLSMKIEDTTVSQDLDVIYTGIKPHICVTSQKAPPKSPILEAIPDERYSPEHDSTLLSRKRVSFMFPVVMGKEELLEEEGKKERGDEIQIPSVDDLSLEKDFEERDRGSTVATSNIFSEREFETKASSIFELFSYATIFDWVLIFFGTVTSIIHGVGLPVFTNVFGDFINVFINQEVTQSFEFLSSNTGVNCSDPNPFNPIFLGKSIANITNYSIPCPYVITNESTYPSVIKFCFSVKNICLDNKAFIERANVLVFFFIAITGAVFILSFFQITLFQAASERQVKKIRLAFYRAILRQELGWFEYTLSGEISCRITEDVDKIQIGIGDNLALLIQWVATFFGGFIIGFIRDWRVALILLIFTPFMMIGVFFTSKLTRTFSCREQKQYASASAVAEEVLSSIHTVVAFGGEQKETERYDKKLKEAHAIGAKKGIAIGFNIGFIYFLFFCLNSVAFWFGSYLISIQQLKGGDILTVFFAVLIGAYSLGQAGPNLEILVTAAGAAGAIFEVIKKKSYIDPSSEEGEKPDGLKGTIEFKDVFFSYPTRPDVQVMDGFNLSVEVGKTYALVGPSGCGKSTVIQLLQRFYDPNAGEVLVGGKDIRSLNVKWLRQNIGVVSQEPVLFDTTIAENILYGKENATREEMKEAAMNANAHDFISKLPDGYETLVGEAGTQLSGGQKQRVAIARALIRDPKILLLDEATSALDTESESVVQQALDRARTGRTTIVIAHRLSTIQNADVIASIEDGRVVEKGTHLELMARKNLYYELVTAQSCETYDGFHAHLSHQRRRISHALGLESFDPHSRRSSFRFDPHSRRSSIRFDPHSSIRFENPHSRRSSIRVDPHSRRSSRVDLHSRRSSIRPHSRRSSIRFDFLQRVRSSSIDQIATALPHVFSRLKRHDSGIIHVRRINGSIMPEFSHSSSKKEEVSEEIPEVSFLRVIKKSAPEWWIIVIGLVGAAISGAIFPSFSIFFGNVLKIFTLPPDQVLPRIHPWATLLIILGVISGVSIFIKNVCFSIAGENLTSRLRFLAFSAMLRQEIGWFDEENNSSCALISQLAEDAANVQGATGRRLGSLVEISVAMVMALVISFVYSWILTIVILGVVPIVVIGGILEAKALLGNNSFTMDKKSLEYAEKVAIDSIINIKTVMSFGLEDKFTNIYSCNVNKSYMKSFFYIFIHGVLFSFSQAVIFIMYAIVFRFGAFQITLPNSNIANAEFDQILVVFVALVFGAAGSGQASSYVPNYAVAKISASRIFYLLDREPLIDSYSEKGLKLKSTSGDIDIQDVDFNYPSRPDVSVLQGLDISVKSGETLALVGPSGCGKSTVVSLLERFYNPLSGTINLDGTNISDLNISWVRRQMGVVSQEPVLFDRSIADNIRYGANYRDVSSEEVIEAAKAANIHNFVDSLPQGYNTNVGTKGTQLSGGQKQRIAIARALVRDPKILLLDEATSALDTESEKIVQEALDKARVGRTSIIIAHRLSTIYNANCIVVISGGKVTEKGTHKELLEKRGLYYKLNRLQRSSKPQQDALRAHV